MFLSVENATAANYATVISTSDLKNHLRVTSSDEDSLVNSYRNAACQFVENYCNTRLTSQSVYFYAQAFGAIGEFQIGPVISVSAVEYKTSKTGSYITLDSANYYVEKARVPALIKFMTAPSTDGDALAPIRVTATCGYSTTPEPLVHAVRLLVAHYFENRQAAEVGNIKEIPLGIKSLLNTYRSISFR
jgi:uncharacterized phiE125 gp8 family phage protein